MRNALAYALAALLLAAPLAAATVDAAEVVGVAHAAGLYNFTGGDFLNEGGDRVLALGSRVIKVFLVPRHITKMYPYNSSWPAAADAVALAAHPHFRDLFAKPFSTYVLVVDPVAEPLALLDGIDPPEAAAERDVTYRLAHHLLTTYAGSGKTFVLQNWEGDHVLRAGLGEGATPSRVRVQAMIDWLNLRQQGVEQARLEVGEDGVTVLHAAEVNHLQRAMAGQVTLTNDVVPFTACDLYSFSSWDADFTAASLVRSLDYLAARAPDNQRFGARNIYLGEFGIGFGHGVAEKERYSRIRELLDAGVGWGVRYALYWQVYCNERRRGYNGRPKSKHLQGFWLVPPEGKRIPLWDTLRGELRARIGRLTLLSGGDFALAVSADGGAAVRRSSAEDPWQELTIKDWNAGALEGGDTVSLLTHGGGYLSVQPGGRLLARLVDPGSAERFVVRHVEGDGRIGDGDAITLQSVRTRKYVGVAKGRPGTVRVTRATPAAAELFRVAEPAE